MSYFNDPAQELFLQLSTAQADLNQRRYEVQAQNPQFAASLSAGSTMYPQASSNLLLAIANGGMPMESPEAQAVIGQEAMVRDVQGPIDKAGEGFWNDVAGVWDEWVDNPVKGATRWTFSAWDAAYNMVAGGAPIRAMQLSHQQGIDYGEAWAEQDPYFFEALGGVIAGEEVNLGSGWMPNSDVATDVKDYVNQGMMDVEQATQNLPTNERYVERLQAAPGVWSQAVSQSAEQAAMGAPLTQLAQTAAESVMFDVGRLGGGTSVTPWSPGRIGASMVLEPGTEGFKWASGTGDFLSQIFADPVDMMGLWWAKAGKAGRMLNSEVIKAADEIVSKADVAVDATRADARELKWMTEADRPSVGYGYQSTDIADKAFRNVEAGPPAIPASTGGRPAGSGGRRTPWWLSPTEIKQNVINAFDPPKWYIDEMASRRGSSAASNEGAKVVRQTPGQYTLNLPNERGSLRIQRKGKGKDQHWVVTDTDGTRVRNIPDDPRFSGSEEFRTLKEAKEAAMGRVNRGTENMNIHGMSPDDFTASGEDFFFPDGMQYMKDGVRIGPNKNEAMNVLRNVRRKGGKGDNTKVRVFGRTVDISDRKVAGKPAGLVKALKADRKLINKGQDIAGNPSVDKFTHTRKWMEENGYGKLVLDNDEVLISEKFIGGDPTDVRSRVWFDRGDKPMTTVDDGIGVVESPTPDKVNELVEMFARSGEGVLDDVDAELAAKVREAAAGRPPLTPELGGVRVDYDAEQMTNILHGKAADLFVSKLAATTRVGGQTNRAAMDRLLTFLTKQGIDVPGDFRRALFEAPDEKSVRAVFARMLTQEGGGTALLPGSDFGRLARAGMPPSAVGRGIGQATKLIPGRQMGVKWSDKPFFARRAAKMLPHDSLNVVENPERAYNLLNQMLPNYNIARGRDLVVDGETVVSVNEVEKLFDLLTDMKPGDGATAEAVVAGFGELFMKSLVGKGVHEDLAKTATRFFKDIDGIRSYDTARVGMTNIKNGAVDDLVLDDLLVGGLDGPQIMSQSWDGSMFFPDAHTVKVIANESDVMGRISNRMTNKFGKDDFGARTLERRTWNLVMQNTMNRIWKPFVLLRAAWTVRIMLDDQLRIAGDGYDVMFRHPLQVMNYAMSRGQDWRTAFTKGYVDVFGEVMSTKNVDNLLHGDMLKAASMSHGDPRIGGAGTRGSRHRAMYGKQDPKYKKAFAGEVRMLRQDRITSALAGAKPRDAVEEVTQYLMGKGLKEKDVDFWMEARRKLATYNRHLSAEDQKKILEGNYEIIHKLVSRQNAMLRQTVGGRVVYDDGAGAVRDYTQFRKVTDVDSSMDGVQSWRVIDNGDEELLNIVAKRSSTVGDLSTDESMKGLEALIGRKVKEMPDRFPLNASMSDITRTGEDAKTVAANYDKALNWMFEWFMSKPSDTFSRIPLFSQAYWQRMGLVANNLSPEDYAKVLANARKGGVEKAFLKAKKEGAEFASEGALSMEKADEMAKAFGFAQVDKSLFDLVNKRNISDSLNLVFPFVEAWGEFLSRWGRIMVTSDRNVKNARRLQQGVEGLREDSGFFSENEYGDEVFNYPAFMTKAQIGVHNMLNNLPGLSQAMGGDISGDVSDSIQMQGRAEGLNFMSSIIPGFGPVFQYAAKAIPDDPGFDWVRERIAPYGTEGGFSMFAPAWFKRVVAAHGGADDPTLTYQFTSTVQDVMRTYMNAGRFEGIQTAEEVNALTKEAENEARGLLMVRAAATYYAPTAPSIRWQTQDETGTIWGYSQLGAEYRKIEDELGSEIAAFDEFYRRFGQLPVGFTMGRTYSVTDKSLTVEGSRFERGNETLFNKYPNSAMYLDPTIGIAESYDHSAMIRQLEASEREQWTADQMVFLQQDFYGDAMMDHQQKAAMDIPKGEGRNAFLATARDEISELYPRWNKQIPGKAQGQRNEDQIAEVMGMLTDPTLVGLPVVAALRSYVNQRQEVLDVLSENGLSTLSGSKSDVAAMAREWLRDEAERITEMHAEFGPMFSKVFYSEVAESHDALPEKEIDMWGDGDIFENVLGMAVSDSVG